MRGQTSTESTVSKGVKNGTPFQVLIKKHTQFGKTLRLCGSVPELGSWTPAASPKLQWHEGDEWRGAFCINLPSNVVSTVKFKVRIFNRRHNQQSAQRQTSRSRQYIVTTEAGKLLEWENGEDHVLSLAADDRNDQANDREVSKCGNSKIRQSIGITSILRHSAAA